MKYLVSICFLSFLLSCSSAQLVDTWKNPETERYSPTKVLVVGLTPEKNARLKFEEQLKNDLQLKGIEVVKSSHYFNNYPTTEEQLKELEYKLLNEGFDTILFTKVVGIEDKILYQQTFNSYEESLHGFNEDYLRHQDIFHNPNYYNEYLVYHAETSMYCICPGKERELLWKGYIDIIDPKDIGTTVKDYVKLIVLVLEEQQLLSSVHSNTNYEVEN